MKNKKQSKKAVAYYRTATTKQSGNNAIDDQKRKCEDWAKKNGYKIVKEYEEIGSGRQIADRAQFTEMIDECLNHPNRIKALIVTDADRISRSNLEFICTNKALEKKGIKLITTNNADIRPSIEYKLLDDILVAAKEFYSKIERRSHEKSSNL